MLSRNKILNLKCHGVKLWGDDQTLRRYGRTLAFISQRFNKNFHSLLDTGGDNLFGRELSKELGFSYHHTTKDLNYKFIDKRDKYDVIFSFEVIEHLMNPLSYLNELKKACSKDTQIFLSYPRAPRWLMSDRHFHEFRDIEFRTLLYEAGYEIIEHETYRNWHNWYFYLSGIRPFIRFWVMLIGLSNIHFYLLRVK